MKSLVVVAVLGLAACAKHVAPPVPSIDVTPVATPAIVAFSASAVLPRAEAVLAPLFKTGLYVPPSGVAPTAWQFFASSNMTVVRVEYYTPYNMDDWLTYLNEAFAAGIQVALSIGEEIFQAGGSTGMITAAMAAHPALWGVVLFDETVWNIEVQHFVGGYGASKAKWLAGVAAGKAVWPGVKLASVDPYALKGLVSDAVIAEYYGDIDRPVIGQYGSYYHVHKEMVEWMYQVTGKNPWTVVQGFAPASAEQLDDWVRGSKDGGALGALWWMWPEVCGGCLPSTSIASQLWADIVGVSRRYGALPLPQPTPEIHRLFLPMILKGTP